MRQIILWLFLTISIPYVLRRPLIGLMIYLGFNIVRPEMLFWGSSVGGHVFVIYYGLVVFSVLINGHLSQIGNIFRKEYFLMLWMITAIFLSIFFTQYHIQQDVFYAVEMAKTLGICAIIYMIVTDFSAMKRLQTVLLGCFTFLGLWGIDQQMRGNVRLEGLGGDAWGDSNGVAAVFALFLPVALARAFQSEKRRDMWISFAMTAVIAILIICTKSRGGFLGILAGLFSFGFFARKTTSVLKIAVVLTILVIPFASKFYLERLRTLEVPTDTENVESSARSRLILWRAGLMNFADNPIVGTGFLTYSDAKMKYAENFPELETSFKEWVFRWENKKVCHNTYIQMFSDCGLVGGIPFVLLIFTGIKAGFKARSKLKEQPQNKQTLWLSGLCAGFTGFAVCIITIDAVLIPFLLIQLTCIGILSRLPAVSDDLQPLNELPGKITKKLDGQPESA